MMDIDLVEYLQELYLSTDYGDTSYPWFSELDRWAELVICLLDQVHQGDERTIRAAVAVLQQLDLLDVEKLAKIHSPTDEYPFVLGYVLQQYGFEKEEAERAIELLADTAQIVKDTFHGKIQIFLRKHGEVMRTELLDLFDNIGLDNQELYPAVSLWLQNAVFVPISLEHTSAKEFCEINEINMEELIQACDESGLNVAFVDRLLAMNSAPEEAFLAIEDELEEDE